MKKRFVIALVLALILTMVPAAASADTDGNRPATIACSTDVYKGVPVNITVKPNNLMYNVTNSITLYVYKGKVSISDFKDGALDKPLKTYSYSFNDVSQDKTFSYSPSATGSITLIAAQYTNGQYSSASSQYLTVKSSSTLETFAVMSPSGFTKSIKDASMNVGFYYGKYYEGVTNKVKVTIKRGSTALKTKEYKMTNSDQYSDKSFKYTPTKTGTYKFTFTGYVNGVKCKSTTCEVKVITPSEIKKVTPSINFIYYDRANEPKSIELFIKGVNGASKVKVYRAKTKGGKYTLVKTTSLKGAFYTTAKYSSTYPYYKIKLTSGKYTSKYSAAVKVKTIGKVSNVKVAEDTQTGYYGGNKYQYMKVTWSKLSGASSYNIYYKNEQGKSRLGTTKGTSYIIEPYALHNMGESAYIYVQPIYEASNVYSYGYYSEGKKLTVKILN